MKLIRFLTSQPPYMGSETAGFDEDAAKRFVDAGVAVHLTDAEVKALRAPKKAAKSAEPETVLVRFIKPTSEGDPRPPAPYLGGETAAFSVDVAEAFIDAGVAELTDKAATAVSSGSAAPDGKPVQVAFVKSAQGYIEGELATFPETEAKAFIKAGLAVLPGDAPVKPAATTADDDVDVLGKTDRAGLEPLGAGSGQK